MMKIMVNILMIDLTIRSFLIISSTQGVDYNIVYGGQTVSQLVSFNSPTRHNACFIEK